MQNNTEKANEVKLKKSLGKNGQENKLEKDI